jgi:disulfide bond formation protein DsbB
MQLELTPRVGNLAGFLACAGMMGAALYFQYGLGLEPCPLCIFQRVGTIALGVAFGVAALHDPGVTGRRIYTGVLAIVAAAGAAVAGRHVWLQNLPKDQVPACGPDLDFMLEAFPLLEVLKTVLSGSGECADIAWQFLGLSMPAWVLILLTLLGVWGVGVNWPSRRATTSRATAAP